MRTARASARQRLLVEAVQLLQAGRFEEARARYRALLAADPGHSIALHHLAIAEHQLGRGEEAIALIRRSLALKPDAAEAHCDLGVILMRLGRDGEAAAALRQAVALKPTLAAAHGNLGDLLRRAGRHREAVAAYDQAARAQPGFVQAHIGRGEALAELGRTQEALSACETALRLAPGMAEAHATKGFALSRQGSFAAAADAYGEALRRDPRLAIVHTRLAIALRALGRFEEALSANARAIEADPGCIEAYLNQALILQALGRYGEALAAYDQALAIKADCAEALSHLGLLLHHLGKTEDALAALRRALDAAPDGGFAYVNLGHVLKSTGQLAEALGVYRAMMARDAGPPPAGLYGYCDLCRQICDWDGLAALEKRAVDAVKASGERVPPFAALAMECSPADHRDIARLWASGFRHSNIHAPAAVAAANPQARIRLGYLSSDFFQHATASLIAELIERHDRAHFEVIAYCSSPNDASPMRARLMKAFDRFKLVRDLSHGEAALQIAADGIDILIDLKGYTREARTMILAQRPASIQVNYLGYPSTMGAPFIDYIIADPFIAPMEHQPFFDERIVHLPDCYQPNDRLRAIASPAPARAACGLPERGFVFASFNNAYKITAQVFDVWMRLLTRLPGSVIWLLDANPLAKANLRREAAARGIDPERLVFAPKLPGAEHLARYALADLFLDNLPVNAHTTASEALWCGLPVVTCAGDVFVGRVAGSLLRACGLPELVTHSLAEYEALALRLAGDPAMLADIRARLGRARDTAPLFDAGRYARHLEAAFTHMDRLRRDGRPPESFAVAELPDGAPPVSSTGVF
jgi:predicted O-linked N-acetylglucosamine transferase (SPINDLY family)